MEAFWNEERKNYKQYESINEDINTSVCIIR